MSQILIQRIQPFFETNFVNFRKIFSFHGNTNISTVADTSSDKFPVIIGIAHTIHTRQNLYTLYNRQPEAVFSDIVNDRQPEVVFSDIVNDRQQEAVFSDIVNDRQPEAVF